MNLISNDQNKQALKGAEKHSSFGKHLNVPWLGARNKHAVPATDANVATVYIWWCLAILKGSSYD